MKPEIFTWLEDIIKSIDEINEFLPWNLDFQSFGQDLKTRRAIERNIEIIGEALNRILQVEPLIAISDKFPLHQHALGQLYMEAMN
jgi:uncharacterized protein with HEPN domain